MSRWRSTTAHRWVARRLSHGLLAMRGAAVGSRRRPDRCDGAARIDLAVLSLTRSAWSSSTASRPSSWCGSPSSCLPQRSRRRAVCSFGGMSAPVAMPAVSARVSPGAGRMSITCDCSPQFTLGQSETRMWQFLQPGSEPPEGVSWTAGFAPHDVRSGQRGTPTLQHKPASAWRLAVHPWLRRHTPSAGPRRHVPRRRPAVQAPQTGETV